jgi:PhnB protein
MTPHPPAPPRRSPTTGNPKSRTPECVYLSLTVDSIPEAERSHSLLADGGQIFMPLQETFFAHRFSMFRDTFGTSWMIIHERPAP